MKSTRKIKVGQLLLPTLPTEDQKAAMNMALLPSASNPFLTKNDEADKNFIFTQNIPSNIWVINHPLAKRPSVSVVDSAGTVIRGQVTYSDNNNLITIEFNSSFSGEAILN